MKSILIKRMEERFGIKKIRGKKLGCYSFYDLLGFNTLLEKGEVIK